MKNKEFYDLLSLDFIAKGENILVKEEDETLVTLEPTTVLDTFYEFTYWLEKDYVEPVELSSDEVVILKNIQKQYEWAARDSNGGLYFYKTKPIKDKLRWGKSDFTDISALKHLFHFIKWEDEEPYNIDELLSRIGEER